MKSVKISTFVVAFALTLPVGSMMLQDSAFATKSDKITICHATNSHTNPYVVNTVNSSSITELNNPHNKNGHGTHDGAIWYAGIADHSWGDIIPAFESPDGHKYAGKNWDSKGQAIYKKGCKMTTPPKETPPSTPTKPTTPTTPTKPTTPTTPTHPKDDDGEVLGEVTTDAATDTKDTLPAELPSTGGFNNWTTLIGVIGLGSITYGAALLIGKFLER